MVEAHKSVPNLVIVPVMISYDRITDTLFNKPDELGDVYVKFLEPLYVSELAGDSLTLT